MMRPIVLLMSFAVLPVAVVGQSAPPARTSTLCWQDLTPELELQGDQLAIAESQLAATGAGDLWLARQWSGPPLLRWSSGKWSDPEPVRPGVDVWVEAVAASATGQITIVAAANDDTTRELHVGRLTKGAWQWLGPPLISLRKANIHAQRAGLAFAGNQPVVLWSESHGIGIPRLFVERWNGKSWSRLGTLNPSSEDTFLTAAIAVDARQQIWLAWPDKDEVRVARWNGSSWIDVDRQALGAISAAQGDTALREITLRIGTDGNVWVLRLASKMPVRASVALVRWDGKSWSEVPAPGGPAGKDATARSASMILRNNMPVVAWSQASETDNRHLYVSEWSSGGRWTPLITGLHFVEGVSNVTDVKVAAADRTTLFVSWDEQGKDKRSTRVVKAYRCAATETAAAPPAAIVERDIWPTTVDQAAQQIATAMDEEAKARVRSTKREDLIQFHFGWGIGIRNSLGLWRGNEKLLESCGGGKPAHPESCSGVIIEAVWELLRAQK